MKKQQEKMIEINIDLTRDFIVILFVMASLATVFVSYLAFGQREVSAAGLQTSQAVSTSKRQFYLTKQAFWGGEALTACATGYHMASLWEILDPSSLQYNTALGFTLDDSGQGPVISASGWVRTGFSNDTSNTPGRGNCNGWTSSDSGDYGTVAYLPYLDWTAGADIGVWKTETDQCSASWHEVWCVED